MKIIEQFVLGKSPDQNKCEDAIFLSDAFIAVIDGATAKSSFTIDGKTSGQKATDLILTHLQSIKYDVDAAEMMYLLNKGIADWYMENGLYEQMKVNAVDRCTAGGIVIYSKNKSEIWFVGDCQVVIDGEAITNEKFIDQLFSDIRAFYLESELLQGKTFDDLLDNDTGTESIQHLIKRQTKFQNLKTDNKFVYSVLDGFFTDIDTIKKVSITPDKKEVVLASDGYPAVCMTLSETEKSLSFLLDEDPLLFRKYKSTKGLKKGNNSFDDRAYIRFALT